MYEIDYEHVINKKIGGVEVTIYFSKQKNEKLKDLVLGLLLDSYENRMQAYLKKTHNSLAAVLAKIQYNE